MTRSEIRTAAATYTAALRAWRQTPTAPAVIDSEGKFPQGRAAWRRATAALADAAEELGRALGRHGCDARDATSIANDLRRGFPDETRKDYRRRMRRLMVRTERVADAIAAALVTKRPLSNLQEARRTKLDELQRADPRATEDDLLDRLRAHRDFRGTSKRTMQRDRAALRASGGA